MIKVQQQPSPGKLVEQDWLSKVHNDQLQHRTNLHVQKDSK